MFWIILLIVLGTVLYFAELVLLPGITIAAIGSFCCLVTASALAFTWGGLAEGFIVLGVILVLLAIITAIFLRPRTWKHAALHTNITETIDTAIDTQFTIGEQGRALTRLAPMGKVVMNGHTVEAKTMGQYVDEGTEVEVIGFDNQNVIVKIK